MGGRPTLPGLEAILPSGAILLVLPMTRAGLKAQLHLRLESAPTYYSERTQFEIAWDKARVWREPASDFE